MTYKDETAAPNLDVPASAAEVLVIGLGNPILGDDGVGWKIAEAVAATAGTQSALEVDYIAVGGLALMERMLGYPHVILIDAIQSGSVPEGTVTTLTLDQLDTRGVGHSASAHDTSLVTALRTAESMGAVVPQRIEIVAVEARTCHDFSENLSQAVAMAVPIAVQQVLSLIRS
jgi:hydrogenase maturation protease